LLKSDPPPSATEAFYSSVHSLDNHHIDVVVLEPATQEEVWRVTGFYGEPRRELRQRSWECLKFLQGKSSLPWMCIGDFNKVLDAKKTNFLDNG
jgi:hypothetical protein